MKEFATISIPVSTHVKKFMTVSFGNSYQLTKNDSLGMMVLAMLTNELKTSTNRDLSFPAFKEDYPVSFSQNYFNFEGFFLSARQTKMIGKTFELYFREKVYLFALINAHLHGKKFKNGIIEFCECYGITADDVDFDSLYKDFKREKSGEKETMITKLNRKMVENAKRPFAVV